MSGNRHTVEIRILADNQTAAEFMQAQRGLQDMGTAAEDTSQRFVSIEGSSRRAAAGIGSLAQGAIAGAGAFAAFKGLDLVMDGVGQAVGFVGDSVVGLNDRLQQATIAFTTMLGSGEAADAFLRDLATFAATTPFEFEDLVTASQRLNAMGIEAGEVVPLMTAVGDSVAALGAGTEGINRAVTAIGQMSARTKVATQEMNQLTEIGIPVWEILSEAIGKSVAETQKLVEQGQIASDVFITAFQDFATVNFGGMMEQQALTFSGAMSTISDSMSMAIARGGEPFFRMLNEGAVTVSEFTQGDQFTRWADTIADATERAGGRLDDLISSERFDEFAGTMEDVGGIVADVSLVVGELALTVGEELIPAVADIIIGLEPVVTGIENLIEVVEAVPSPSEDKKARWQEFWEGIGEGATGAAEDVAHWAIDLVPRMEDGQVVLLDGLIKLGNAAAESGRSFDLWAFIQREVQEETQRTTEYQRQSTEMTDEARAAVEELTREYDRGTIALHRANDMLANAAGSFDIAAVSAASLERAIGNVGAVTSSWRGVVDDSKAAFQLWESDISENEEAIKALDEALADGTISVDEHRDKVETLEWWNRRLESGVDDMTLAWADNRVEAAEVTRQLEDLEQQHKDGKISTAEYESATADLRAEWERQNDPLANLLDKISELIDLLLETDALDPHVDVTADTADAEAAVQRLKDMITSGAILPISIVPGPAGGGVGPSGERFAEGGISEGGMALVGEKGPELAFLPRGTHILSNADSKRFLGGFADGTGTIGGSLGQNSMAATVGGAMGRDFGEAFSVGAINAIVAIPAADLFDMSGTPGAGPSTTIDEFGFLIGLDFTGGINEGLADGAVDLFSTLEGVTDETADIFRRYIEAVIEDGDFLNDWLTHLPEPWRDWALNVGRYIEAVMQDGDFLNDWLTHLPEEHREALEDLGEVWAEGLLEAWNRAVSSIQSQFTGPGIADIMTGEAQANLQADIAAMEAYMEALLEAGFSPDSPAFQQVLEDYNALLVELAAMNAVAGTEAAQEFWEAWIEEQERLASASWGPATRRISDGALWGEHGRIAANGFVHEFEETTLDSIIGSFIPNIRDELTLETLWGAIGSEAGGLFGQSWVDAATDQILGFDWIDVGSEVAKNVADALDIPGTDVTQADINEAKKAAKEAADAADADSGAGGLGASPGGDGGIFGVSAGPGGAQEAAIRVLRDGMSDAVLPALPQFAGIDPSNWLGQFAGQGHKLAITGAMADALIGMWGLGEWLEIKDQYLPGGVTGPGGVEFADGGYTTASGMAMLHSDEYITPDKSIPKLAKEIVAELRRVSTPTGNVGSSQPLVVQMVLDGRVFEERVINVMSQEVQRMI